MAEDEFIDANDGRLFFRIVTCPACRRMKTLTGRLRRKVRRWTCEGCGRRWRSIATVEADDDHGGVSFYGSMPPRDDVPVESISIHGDVPGGLRAVRQNAEEAKRLKDRPEVHEAADELIARCDRVERDREAGMIDQAIAGALELGHRWRQLGDLVLIDREVHEGRRSIVRRNEGGRATSDRHRSSREHAQQLVNERHKQSPCLSHSDICQRLQEDAVLVNPNTSKPYHWRWIMRHTTDPKKL